MPTIWNEWAYFWILCCIFWTTKIVWLGIWIIRAQSRECTELSRSTQVNLLINCLGCTHRDKLFLDSRFTVAIYVVLKPLVLSQCGVLRKKTRNLLLLKFFVLFLIIFVTDVAHSWAWRASTSYFRVFAIHLYVASMLLWLFRLELADKLY